MSSQVINLGIIEFSGQSGIWRLPYIDIGKRFVYLTEAVMVKRQTKVKCPDVDRTLCWLDVDELA